MGREADVFSSLEADGAFRFVLPRLPDGAYLFPQPEASVDEDFDVYS
ncbi:hypothetical protein [Cloacibacillus sp. An23]|nr:hypothetical protein [Cloacibacillus sp. An23]